MTIKSSQNLAANLAEAIALSNIESTYAKHFIALLLRIAFLKN
jgi:hypothetical protein